MSGNFEERSRIWGIVDGLEKIVDARTEDQEQLWQRLAILEDQHIELQLKQEDLENRVAEIISASGEFRSEQRGAT